METSDEIWRPIAGYEGYYEVSNLGRVLSLERISIHRNGKIRKVKKKILVGVRAMRMEKLNGVKLIEIAKNFGASYSLTQKVCSGLNWRHVE